MPGRLGDDPLRRAKAPSAPVQGPNPDGQVLSLSQTPSYNDVFFTTREERPAGPAPQRPSDGPEITEVSELPELREVAALPVQGEATPEAIETPEPTREGPSPVQEALPVAQTESEQTDGGFFKRFFDKLG